ncbi:MAG: hypothetical protein HY821_02595 [Acidobacteria bacterium]|nr:hypothetical protein [Acidobacteriota bacterium]
MRKVIVLMIALAMAAGAQEAPKWQQKVFDVKYADVQALANLIRGVCQSRETRVLENPPLRAISVGTPDSRDLAAAEELVKRYDVSSGAVVSGRRNIELIAYMLMAAQKGSSGEALPADLEPVAKQLKAVFGYNDLRLVDTAMVRAREGVRIESSGNAGVINPTLPQANSTYQFSIARSIVMPSEKGNLIKLDGFRFGIRVPYATTAVQSGQASQGIAPLVATQINYSEVGFNTELDIREGQKVVVGKAKVDGTGSAFILVLTAKAVD